MGGRPPPPGRRTRSVVAAASGAPAGLGRRCRKFHAGLGYTQRPVLQSRVEPGVRLACATVADAVQHEPEIFRDLFGTLLGDLREVGGALAGPEERLGVAGPLVDAAAE